MLFSSSSDEDDDDDDAELDEREPDNSFSVKPVEPFFAECGLRDNCFSVFEEGDL